ncbi:MAG: DUF2225 domain-containing protein [Candidatus Omnitrophota bacterium]
MSRNIYIENKVICPVCKNPFVLKYPNAKMVVASGRDFDQRVTGYTWAQGITTDEIPHYYAVAQCPHCLFADLRENIEMPKSGVKEAKLYETFKTQDFKRLMILKKLRRLVTGEKMDFKAALSLHIAAIYANLLIPKEFIDHNKLGRLYLRLSWLYKEQRNDDEPAEGTDKNESVASPALDALFKVMEGIQSNFQGIANDLAEARKWASARSTELKIAWEDERNPYSSLFNALENKWSEFQTHLDIFQQSILKDKKGTLNKPAVSAGAIPMDEATLRELNDIATKWIGFPASEEYCVQHAIEAFDNSYKFEDTERSTEQSLAIVNLIIKLLLKVGDHNGALAYVMQMLTNGSREKQGLQMRLNEGKRNHNLTPFDEKNIMRKMATITGTMSQGMEIRDNILETILNKNKEKIVSLIKSCVDKPVEEQQKVLLDAGLPEVLIPFLRSRGILKTEEAKKGWFGMKK